MEVMRRLSVSCTVVLSPYVMTHFDQLFNVANVTADDYYRRWLAENSVLTSVLRLLSLPHIKLSHPTLVLKRPERGTESFYSGQVMTKILCSTAGTFLGQFSFKG